MGGGSPGGRQSDGLESRRHGLAPAFKQSPFIQLLGFVGYSVKEIVLGFAPSEVSVK